MAETKTIKSRVELANAMVEASKTCKSHAVGYAFIIATGCLMRMAERAIELNDGPMIEELVNIGYITLTPKPIVS